ncbi:EamA family transporter [Alteromonas ponticola]|uniref:EamA family transporter n=1 Tax=Alteromonas aquimaris TaxID=2998417 RepID=A0ABT3PAJ8_9ALTE|nr:EamA family transporter [Alteromonas aquimaris]MCW8109560.1 EamA family transporter [Alteromonas aquimaris]
MSLHTVERKGIFAIVLASVLWGTTGTAASYSADVSPLAIGAFATGFGGILMLITAWPGLKKDKAKLLAYPFLFIVGSACVAIYPLAFYSSMRLSGVAIGTVISLASAPFFAAVIECLYSKTRISSRWWFRFLIGAIGITLLAHGKMPGPLTISQGHVQELGILLGLVAGLTYAGYSWVGKQLINRGVKAQSSMAALFGGAASLLVPSLLLTGDNLFATPIHITVSVYMALVPMYAGYLLFGYGLTSVDASNATLITLFEPVVATLLAILLLGEKFDMLGWVGMGMISLCLLLHSYPQTTAARQSTRHR